MSTSRLPLLVMVGGCAAMIAAAATAVAIGAFYTDMPVEHANASPVRATKVKTTTISPQTTIEAPAPVRTDTVVAAQPAAVAQSASTASAAHKTTKTEARPSQVSSQVPGQTITQPDIAATLESAFAAQGAGARSTAALATDTQMGQSSTSFAKLASDAENGPSEVELPTDVAMLPTPDARPTEHSTERPTERSGATAPQTADTGDDQAVSGRTITLRDGVNMRSAPRSGSGVLLVVPSGAKVSLAPGCKQWCEISYNGRTGYIFRSFISGDQTASRQSAPRQATARQSAQSDDKPAVEIQNDAQSGLFGNGGTINNAGAAPARKKPVAEQSTAGGNR